MRPLKFIAILALAGFASTAVFATDSTSESGVLIYKRQKTIADTSTDPAATTVGQFFHNSPPSAPGRVPMVPTKEVAVLKVRKANGEKIEIRQDWEDSRKLTVGDNVVIEQVDGGPRVVSADVGAN